jgi:hypothetical protein
MTQLEKIKRDAQAAANRDGRPVAVFNLNLYNPLYVMRHVAAGAAAPKDALFVALPAGANTEPTT